MTEHYITTVLAFPVSVKQWRGPKMCQSHITMPTGSIPNAYNGYLRISDPQHRGGPCHSSRKSVTNNIRVYI